MRDKNFFKGQMIPFFLAFSFLFAITTQDASCKWDDKSDELPGMSDGAVVGLAVGAVVVAGLAAYLIIKSKKASSTSQTLKYSNPEKTIVLLSQSPSDMEKAMNYQPENPVQFKMDFQNPVHDFHCPGAKNAAGISVGVSFSF